MDGIQVKICILASLELDKEQTDRSVQVKLKRISSHVTVINVLIAKVILQT